MIKPYFETELGKLYHGDCLEVMREVAPESVNCCVTSPPYNRVQEYSGGGPGSTMENYERKKDLWYEDEMPEEEYQKWQREVISELMRITDGSIFYNHKIRYAYGRRQCIYHPLDWIRDFPIWTEIIWDRCGSQGGNSKRFLVSDERIYQIKRPHIFNGAMGYTTVWRIPPVSISDHVCPFPVEIPKRCIESTTKERDMVLDPFLGSGTTAIACERLNRRWIGIEISKEYCDIAVDRIKKETAQLKLDMI